MIFSLFLSALALTSVQSNLVKRTIEDGQGDDKFPGAHFEYSYNGHSGPLFWPKIAPACGGRLQSPINIEPTTVDFKDTINGVMTNNGAYPNIVYPAGAGKVKHYGDTLKFYPSDPNAGTFTRPDGSYKLAQFHIHMPSEHRVDGDEWPGEIHFVHKKSDGSAYAVIGGFVQFGPTSSPMISELVKAKNLKKHEEMTLNIDYTDFVTRAKASPKIYRYTGSLTTPPCTEGIKWHVLSAPAFNITVGDFAIIKSQILYSARETMPLFDMYDPDWAVNRKSDYA